jgi:hypothetical protein
LYLSNYSVSEDRGSVLVTWTTNEGFTCEDINVKFGTDSNDLVSVYTYPGICGSTEKEEKYSYLFHDVVYNQPNYFSIDLGSFGESPSIAITLISVNGLNPKVYPNPASPLSTIIFENPDLEMAQVRLYTETGIQNRQVISTRTNKVTLSQFNITSPGLYFFTVEIKGVIRRGKFLFL